MLTRTKTWMAALLGMVGATACDNRTANDTHNAPSTSPASSSGVTNTNAVVETKHDPLAGVTNRDRLTLDPNATNVDPPKPVVLVTGISTLVRESPRGSKIEVLETTANVREIERDGDYFLITYPDPKGSSKVFAGWVYRDALVGEGWSPSNPTAGAPRATGKLACNAGDTHLRTTSDFCGKTCKDDRDCESDMGAICDGLAFKVNEKTDTTSDARYCISIHSPTANGEHSREHGGSSDLPVHK